MVDNNPKREESGKIHLAEGTMVGQKVSNPKLRQQNCQNKLEGQTRTNLRKVRWTDYGGIFKKSLRTVAGARPLAHWYTLRVGGF
jgi:hypothetical protein